ncbi:hypothetical protein [Dietzia sp. ANT_WB102]|uniref:hypothetical protein n=1 Tax=Dietzia sp. ANT_WB102 TaxID=2597345 RepID=UPI0011F08376|nr:hypothetical protein [Dietzia sp. ANT_WB102]KAA0916453.1 hypothetical protein FQ137_14610 [Dietzia sp. ANT_WB102]
MTLTPQAHQAVEHLDVTGIDALIALTHADITWHNPTFERRAWEAIDALLDRRNTLTGQT